ncbi:Acyl-CoA synthetase (AMP-forming)/AMP-acid ligase II [Streptomyces sp. cf124]|uniref:AMP-binding protein n=1 Tax=unclassified Streptomyces TaxID=2593676 RepID=UPI0005EF6B7C|nr:MULTISPECIES: AMP-binding protein [unclassified Streptomyces]SFN11594.1 Acyl-CoA synthetase (AMP-forming)/AMP-acid ligase II [Streptomyces sp. cf124]
MDVSIGTIWEAVSRALPDAVAITEPGRELTYREFDDRAARLAAALEDAGVRAGDTVACYLYNGSAYLETVFAAFKLGAVPANANYRYTGEELSELLADADAAALVFSGALADRVAHAAGHVRTLKLLVRAGDPPTAGPAGPAVPELEELLARHAPRAARPRPGSDRLFMYTGGTTGKPKGVMWQLGDLLHSIPILRQAGVTELPKTLEEAASIAVAARREGRAPTTMPVVPLMHATGLFNTMGTLLVGGRAVMARQGGLDPVHVWRTLAEREVDTLLVAGNAVCRPLVDELVRAEGTGTPYDLRTLRTVLSSGTALDDRLKKALHERAGVTVVDAIASSEGGPFALAVTSSVRELPARFHPVPATRVIGEGDRFVEPGSGETGVLAYCGPMPLGYYKDTGKSARTFRTIDGVRYSVPGDLAQIEADGAIRFLGRGSGVINTGGEKVHPQEVEDVLLTHPEVKDCVVVGVPDETWGERVAAVVAVGPAATTTGEELREWVRRSLAGYKVPRSVVLTDVLPRTPTGKLEIAWARRTAQNAGPAGG